jgi:hypothetical protein
MQKHNNTPINSLQEWGKNSQLTLQFIIKKVETGTGLSLSMLKKRYSEEQLFYVALKHVTTTKKALCTALKIPVEAGCRYKRSLEKDGKLVESIKERICPITKHYAHLISTNPSEFEGLLKSINNQLNLFE